MRLLLVANIVLLDDYSQTSPAHDVFALDRGRRVSGLPLDPH
jgi:hypothetical protein